MSSGLFSCADEDTLASPVRLSGDRTVSLLI